MYRASKIARSAPPENPTLIHYVLAGTTSSAINAPASGSPSYPHAAASISGTLAAGSTSPASHRYFARNSSSVGGAEVASSHSAVASPESSCSPASHTVVVFIAFVLYSSLCGDPAATLSRA